MVGNVLWYNYIQAITFKEIKYKYLN